MVECEHEIEFLQDDAKIASYQTWDRYKITYITYQRQHFENLHKHFVGKCMRTLTSFKITEPLGEN